MSCLAVNLLPSEDSSPSYSMASEQPAKRHKADAKAEATAPFTLPDVKAAAETSLEDRHLRTFKHWTLGLHENQCYLGRMVLWAHREE